MHDDDLIAIAMAAAAARGYTAELDATVTDRTPQAHVLLGDPAAARGGGLLVIIDPATGTVLDTVPQL
jgi:hypothetical protein